MVAARKRTCDSKKGVLHNCIPSLDIESPVRGEKYIMENAGPKKGPRPSAGPDSGAGRERRTRFRTKAKRRTRSGLGEISIGAAHDVWPELSIIIVSQGLKG